jgi:hypothetical protein
MIAIPVGVCPAMLLVTPILFEISFTVAVAETSHCVGLTSRKLFGKDALIDSTKGGCGDGINIAKMVMVPILEQSGY